MDKIEKQRIVKHYNLLVKKFGLNNSGMGWRNDQLDNRYEIFLKHINFQNKTVLDFGCGICLFQKYLKKKIKVKKYYGIEINKNLIDILVRSMENKGNIFTKNQFIKKKKKIDISISNGVHNFKTKNAFKNFLNDLKFLTSISKYAVGISFLNDNVDYKENYLSYKNLNKILIFLKSKKYRFIIDNSFKKYETFLIIYK